MPKSETRADRIKSVILAVFLIGVVLYFALTAIPSAERPSLRTPAPTPSSTRTVGNT
ncbi:MAG TPA: hypothetical protein VFT67_17670 [Jatrophihabitantaceae bacterium]|nr:hypothetical protein [Jatrophihabitantaceae bacterium]